MVRGNPSDCQRADPSTWGVRGPSAPHAWLRWAPLAVLLALVAAALLSGAWRWLSLDQLRDRREALQAYVRVHPVLSLELYAGAYMLLVALSLPGALIMSLSGGYLFGAWMGAGAALVGETAGAVLMYGATRLVSGRWIGAGIGAVIRIPIEGMRENAVSTLLALRLMPGLPFGLVNLAAGLARVRFLTYLWTTVVGIAPSTFIYCSVGSGLGRAFTRSGAVRLHALVTPALTLPVAGLALLALVPLAVRVLRRNPSARRRGSASTSAP